MTCNAGLMKIICIIGDFFQMLVPILIGLGVLYFVWGIIQFMIADTEEAKTKGKDTIMYGLIGFAVIIAMWGLVNLILDTFDLNNQNNVVPSSKINVLLPTSSNSN